MNILYRGCESREGYQSKILNELYEKGIFTKCTIITQTADGQDKYPAGIYHEIPAGIGYKCRYKEICDIDNLPALSEDILLKMKKYESTALDMNCRNYHMHINNYNEMEAEYLEHLRFWNYLLDNEQIKFAFFCTVPHHMWEYIIYALAKVKNIPVLIVSISNILGLSEVGTSIENLGNNGVKYFKEHHSYVLGKEINEYYNKLKTEKKYLSVKERQNLRKNNEKWVFKAYYNGILSPIKYKSRAIIKDVATCNIAKLKKDYKIFHDSFECGIRILGHKLKMKDERYYDKHFAVEVDFDSKYIFFALQYVPESSVLPRGGAFSNQLLSIRILAQAAAKRGIKVYVKEHYLQHAKEKMFYEELKNMPNVYMLSIMEDTYKIIDKSLAVSSQTGTCMTEAIVRGIPVITFGNHVMCGSPGVFRVGSIEETNKVLDIIDSSEYHIDEKEIKRYFHALEKTLVKSPCEWRQIQKFPMSEWVIETVDVIEKFVEDGMAENFYYYKQ